LTFHCFDCIIFIGDKVTVTFYSEDDGSGKPKKFLIIPYDNNRHTVAVFKEIDSNKNVWDLANEDKATEVQLFCELGYGKEYNPDDTTSPENCASQASIINFMEYVDIALKNGLSKNKQQLKRINTIKNCKNAMLFMYDCVDREAKDYFYTVYQIYGNNYRKSYFYSTIKTFNDLLGSIKDNWKNTFNEDFLENPNENEK